MWAAVRHARFGMAVCYTGRGTVSREVDFLLLAMLEYVCYRVSSIIYLRSEVLDKGYVRLVRIDGTELDIVNAARLSYDSESNELTDKDIRLINFLVRERHTSPFRHVGMSLEFKAPMMVARQHWRHIIGASTLEEGTPYSELSRRYVRGNEEFYVPSEWRSAPENSKQGSGGVLDKETSNHIAEMYEDYIEYADNLYHRMLDLGVAPEQARIVLPANALYTKYLWTPSLQAAMAFVDLRTASDAQFEIQPFAIAVDKIILDNFPNVYSAWKANLSSK